MPQSIYGTLKEANFLEEKETEQLYSEALGKFLADRFVCGTCPKCGYEVRPASAPAHSPATSRAAATATFQAIQMLP